MDWFYHNLRKVSNHLGDEDHSKLHIVIREVAKSVFGEEKDEKVVDWLHTEDMHAEMKGESPIYVKDFRCDTDRTMFGVLHYLMEKPQFASQLQKFREGVEPYLDKFELTPAFTIDTLDAMPWDAGHILHAVLCQQFQRLSFILLREKVVRKDVLMKYIEDCRRMESDYFNFGLELLQGSLLKCNQELQGIVKTLETYLSRARVKTSERYRLSSELVEHIGKLVTSL